MLFSSGPNMPQPTPPSTIPLNAKLLTNNRGKRTARILVGILVTGFLIAFFLLNSSVPQFADDYCRVTFGLDIQQIFSAVHSEYLNWTGRFVVMFLSRFTFALGETGLLMFNILNTLMMLLAIVTVIRLTDASSRRPLLVFVCFAVFIWFTPHRFGEVVLWKTGAIQYFWGCVVTLVLFSRLFDEESFETEPFTGKPNSQRSNRPFTALLPLALIGFLVGAWLENLGAAVAAILGVHLTLFWWKTQTVSRPILIALVGTTIGLIMLVGAPGNYVRANSIGESLVFFEVLLITTGRLMDFANPYLLGLLVVSGIISWRWCPTHFYHALPRVLTFIGIGVLSVLALSFAPAAAFIGRAAFPLEFFLVIAVCLMFPYELFNKLHYRTDIAVGTTVTLVCGIIWMVDYQQVAKGYGQIQKLEVFRTDIIHETKKRRIPPPVPLPALAFSNTLIVGNRTINEGRYFARDIDRDATHWRNQCYAAAHKVESVRLVVLSNSGS